MAKSTFDAFLDAADIRGRTFIRHVELHDTLASTNDRAIELSRDREIKLPALIATREQTAGRGRGSNQWHSTEGALTFSVLFEPTAFGITPDAWPKLSLTTAVAVCDALSAELSPQSAIRNPKSPTLAIKWPNDIVLNDAKVCGILIESPGGAAPAKDRLVIGIGINANNSWSNTPPAARGLAKKATAPLPPTALCDLTGHRHDLQHVLCETFRSLGVRNSQLATSDPQLPVEWKRRSWLTRQHIEVNSNGEWIQGVCLGIESDGSLLVENTDGTHRIRSGSVRVI